jgi:glycosyltransferase involved in cell wall biosynthesis
MRDSFGEVPSMARVGVVIPCFNLGSYVLEAVQSVHDQTFRDWELLIVDDGSTEAQTIQILDRLAEEKRCALLRTENRGVAHARNAGIARVDCPFLLCLDADDCLQPSYLEKTLPLFSSDASPRVGFVTTYAQFFGQSQGLWPCSDFSPLRLLVENLIHVASVFSRELWTDVGGFSPDLTGYHDWDFWLGAVTRGWAWRRVPEPLFHYRVREGSILKGSERKRLALRRQIAERHQDFFQQHVVDLVVEYEKLLRRRESEAAQEAAKVAREALKRVAILEEELAVLRNAQARKD